jgi:cell division protease FtsH
VFLGYDKGHEADYSPEVAGVVDGEVRQLIDTAHDRARSILTTHRDTLDVLASALVEKETLEDDDLAEIFGPLDKGTGITPKPEATDEPVPIEPELVGAGADAMVAEGEPAEGGPASERSGQVAPARRRWWKRAGVRAPRPSGT